MAIHASEQANIEGRGSVRDVDGEMCRPEGMGWIEILH